MVAYNTMFPDSDLDVASIEKKYSYRLNNLAKPRDMKNSASEKENIIRAALLKKGDGAFVLRSDRTWRFAIVLQTVLHETPQIDLMLNKKGSTKCLSLKYWATNIRAFRRSTIIHSNEDQLLVFHLSRAFEMVKNKKQDTTSVNNYLKKLFPPSTAKIQDFSDEQVLDESQKTCDPLSKMPESENSIGSKRNECEHTSLSVKPASILADRKGSKLRYYCASTTIDKPVVDSSASKDNTHTDLRHDKVEMLALPSSESRQQIEASTNHQALALSKKLEVGDAIKEKIQTDNAPNDKTNHEEKSKVVLSMISTVKHFADHEKFQSLFESWMQKEVVDFAQVNRDKHHI